MSKGSQISGAKGFLQDDQQHWKGVDMDLLLGELVPIVRCDKSQRKYHDVQAAFVSEESLMEPGTVDLDSLESMIVFGLCDVRPFVADEIEDRPLEVGYEHHGEDDAPSEGSNSVHKGRTIKLRVVASPKIVSRVIEFIEAGCTTRLSPRYTWLLKTCGFTHIGKIFL